MDRQWQLVAETQGNDHDTTSSRCAWARCLLGYRRPLCLGTGPTLVKVFFVTIEKDLRKGKYREDVRKRARRCNYKQHFADLLRRSRSKLLQRTRESIITRKAAFCAIKEGRGLVVRECGKPGSIDMWLTSGIRWGFHTKRVWPA
jgi:hypothetical protein